ncbi:CD48 antigen-like isoform X2 [Melanotaenia boesemani]|nr:CD48 antigen-like isoform X2 [Melanotaenia boesemani]
MILSAAEGEKKMTGVVGGNITLPHPVKNKGFLIYNSANIASVKNRIFEILEKIYTDKISWDDKTGFFTIDNLQKNDSGNYTVDCKDGNGFHDYRVTVYDAAPPPAVRRLNSSDGCLLECRVEEKTELSWYKDEQILNQSSSGLSLLLTVQEQDFSSSYRCVAANPAESKTLPVDAETSCREENKAGSLEGTNSGHHWVIVVSIVSVLIVILASWMIKRKFLGQQRNNQTNTKQEKNCLHSSEPDEVSGLERGDLETQQTLC